MAVTQPVQESSISSSYPTLNDVMSDGTAPMGYNYSIPAIEMTPPGMFSKLQVINTDEARVWHIYYAGVFPSIIHLHTDYCYIAFLQLVLLREVEPQVLHLVC